jgi:hypothetical protein
MNDDRRAAAGCSGLRAVEGRHVSESALMPSCGLGAAERLFRSGYQIIRNGAREVSGSVRSAVANAQARQGKTSATH